MPAGMAGSDHRVGGGPQQPMLIESLSIPEVRRVVPRRHGDHRGFFAEVYNKRDFAEADITVDFVQDNHSRSEEQGTLRGLHFQLPPHAQAKLVRCVRGAIFDVAVDLRRDSPSYGKSVGVVLSADNGHELYIPAGFAHGFCTLEPGCEVVYKASSYYAPQHDAGLRWNDPELAVDWPVAAPILSAKDAQLPWFADFDSPFTTGDT
jgi:dTDP-4-dehydrorhamnose 3,5-epimerase